jgi:hypothetical protein
MKKKVKAVRKFRGFSSELLKREEKEE